MNISPLYSTLVFRLCLFLPAPLVLFSQIQQPNRFEKERKYSDEDLTIVPMATDGLALVFESKKFKSSNQTWEITLLDTILQKVGSLELEIEQRNRLIGYDHTVGMVYLLFKKDDTKGEMYLISIDLKTKETVGYEIKPELNFQLTQFSKVGKNFVFGGYVNFEPAVLLYNSDNNNIKILPGFFQKETELIDVRVNKNQTFNALTIDRGDRDTQKIIFRTFDSSGKQLLEDITDIEGDITLQNSISSTLDREDLMIIGSFGKRKTKQASGFYSLQVNPFEEQKINRVYFGQLNHYLDYLKPKKAARIKLKSLNAIEGGQIPDLTNYVMPFKIVEHTNGFLLLAESYTASSSNQQSVYSPYSNYPYYYSPYGYGGYYPGNRVYNQNTGYSSDNNMPNTQDIKTVQSVVLAFDAKGKIMMDFSQKLSEIKMSTLDQVSEFLLCEDSIHFLYKKESELKIKTIDLDSGEFSEREEKIKLNDVYDEIRMERSQEGSVKHWFNRAFYVWGYQSIRNNSKGQVGNREVFYINRIVVR